MGIRHSLNRAPIMNPTEQNTSANITSDNDSMLPIPKGSGNDSDESSNVIHFAIPWLRNVSPKAMRAARIRSDDAVYGKCSGKR
jgi:hypothetical protein